MILPFRDSQPMLCDRRSSSSEFLRVCIMHRIDVIKGDISTETVPLETNENLSTKVLLRAERQDLAPSDEYLSLTYTIEDVQSSFYLRLRGTNTGELEPTEDPDREDPWSDLWFYSNPIFVSVVKP